MEAFPGRAPQTQQHPHTPHTLTGRRGLRLLVATEGGSWAAGYGGRLQWFAIDWQGEIFSADDPSSNNLPKRYTTKAETFLHYKLQVQFQFIAIALACYKSGSLCYQQQQR
jgi:hypothetical protein